MLLYRIREGGTVPTSDGVVFFGFIGFIILSSYDREAYASLPNAVRELRGGTGEQEHPYLSTAETNALRLFLLAIKGVTAMPIKRLDRTGTHQTQFRLNKKKIYATQTVCGICGLPVDFSLKYPHPLSACIDHIIPVAKGGHPSDINNLQLAHWCCNRQKSDKLMPKTVDVSTAQEVNNRDLPLTFDWSKL